MNYYRHFVFSRVSCALFQGFFKVQIDVFFPSLSHDIDNAAKIILDCLQSSKVIKNDNRCVELLMRKFKDAVNPRCVITIEEVEL